MMTERSFIWQRHRAQMTPRGEVEWVELCEVIYRIEREATPPKYYPIDDAHPGDPAEILIVAVYDRDGDDQIHGLTDDEAQEIYEIALDCYEESPVMDDDSAYDRWKQNQVDNEQEDSE